MKRGYRWRRHGAWATPAADVASIRIPTRWGPLVAVVQVHPAMDLGDDAHLRLLLEGFRYAVSDAMRARAAADAPGRVH